MSIVLHKLNADEADVVLDKGKDSATTRLSLITAAERAAQQTVDETGALITTRLDGVLEHFPPTHEDERGSLCEIYNLRWDFDDLALVHAYLVTARPGKVKGWACHLNQVDRYFFATGTAKLVLFDARADSPTSGMISESVYSPLRRALVSVPPGVFHAVANIGLDEVMLFNIPSEPYNYESPDKITLPLDTEQIPYRFENLTGH